MKKIRVTIIAIISLTCFILIPCLYHSLAQEATANTPGALFYQANIYYQEGKYDAAINNYEQIINRGLESGNLYYNLGNSYFKKCELGLAVLSYDRAKVFIPNDSDLSSNYEYALESLNLEHHLSASRFNKLVHKLFQHLTIDNLAILLSFIYIVLVIFFMLHLFSPGFKRLWLGFIYASTILFVISAYALNSKINYIDKTAVVLTKEAEVKFGPLENATTYFKLTEGDKVEVVEKAEGWYKARRFDNKIGWVRADFIRLIK